MLLEKRVAIVSGIGPGMGRDVALLLAREGADVALAARSEATLASVADEVRALGRRALALRTDITSAQDCAALAARTRAELGRIDVLVNNAYAAGPFKPADELDADAWRAPFEVNLVGSMQLTRAVVPAMKAQRSGSIVMVNSMIIRNVLPTMGPYAASKAALMAATQALARELGPHGIRVNSVVPGYIWGPTLEAYFAAMARERGVPARQVYDEVASQTALGRIPTSEEIAPAVLFFASELSRAVTGQSLDVNAGQVFH